MKSRHLISLLSTAVLVFYLYKIVNRNDNFEKQYISWKNASYIEMKNKFGIDYLKLNLLSHFPSKIIDTTDISMRFSSPTCSPSFVYGNQFGDAYLITPRDTTTEKWIKKNYFYKTEYQSDSNIIINLPELKFNWFSIEKCNNKYKHKYPIPFFESYNFNFGKKTLKKETDSMIYAYNLYTVPKDLTIYVIEAEAGNFWKEDCQEIRHGLLNEWKNGYSKGIAISEDKNLMVYWTMIW